MQPTNTYSERKRFKLSQRTVLSGAVALLFLLVVGVVVYWRSAPGTVYLPRPTRHTTTSGARKGLPTQEDYAFTPYGLARVFRSPDDTQIYELKTNRFLRASACPNITKQATLNPSSCAKIGTLYGHDIYELHRSDARMATEQFVSINGTFIVVVFTGYGPSYVNTFAALNSGRIPAYLGDNRKL